MRSLGVCTGMEVFCLFLYKTFSMKENTEEKTVLFLGRRRVDPPLFKYPKNCTQTGGKSDSKKNGTCNRQRPPDRHGCEAWKEKDEKKTNEKEEKKREEKRGEEDFISAFSSFSNLSGSALSPKNTYIDDHSHLYMYSSSSVEGEGNKTASLFSHSIL